MPARSSRRVLGGIAAGSLLLLFLAGALGCEGVIDGSTSVCGDGVVAGAEVCDDGTNDALGGGCLPGCGALWDAPAGEGVQSTLTAGVSAHPPWQTHDGGGWLPPTVAAAGVTDGAVRSAEGVP